MKIFRFCLISIAIIAAVLLNQGNATNSTFGFRKPGDFLIYRQNVFKESHWLRVVTEDILYPPRGSVNYYNLTAIYAIDRARKNGGFGYLLRGGPGSRNATLHLKSERSHGLNFTIEFYGRSY